MSLLPSPLNAAKPRRQINKKATACRGDAKLQLYGKSEQKAGENNRDSQKEITGECIRSLRLLS